MGFDPRAEMGGGVGADGGVVVILVRSYRASTLVGKKLKMGRSLVEQLLAGREVQSMG